MNFSYNEEQQLLQQSMQRWFQDNYSFEQRQTIADSAQGFSQKHWQTFAEMGWLSIPFAEQHGGYGGSTIDIAAMMEEFGKAIVLEPMTSTLLQFGGVLQEIGNENLAGELIPQIIEGKILGALATYEAQARFDLSNIATTASKHDDGYLLTGEKSLVSGAPYADYLIVSARISGSQTDEEGIGLFLLPKDADGLSMQSHALMDGQQVADIKLSEVRADLLCDGDNGYRVLQSVSQNLDVALCAEALGIMQMLNEATVEYTKTRKQFGVPISSFQALQHRMVDTFMAFEMSKSLLYGTLCELTNGVTDAKEAAQAVNALRALIAKNGKLIGDEAIQLHGGMGMTDELNVGHYVKRLLMINLQFGNGEFYQKRFNQLAYRAA